MNIVHQPTRKELDPFGFGKKIRDAVIDNTVGKLDDAAAHKLKGVCDTADKLRDWEDSIKVKQE